jgi:hypothetical protein
MVEIVEDFQAPHPLPPDTRKPPKLDEMGKVLLKARDIIRDRGWVCGAYEDGRRVCTAAAINLALGFPPDSWLDEIWTRRLNIDPWVHGDITGWNDTGEQSQQSVEERLERAAYTL